MFPAIVVECELVPARTAEGFLAKLATDGHFDLALIDLQLTAESVAEGSPGGRDLLHQLNKINSPIPRVVLTAQPGVLGVEQAIAIGINEYYLKDVLIASSGSSAPQE